MTTTYQNQYQSLTAYASTEVADAVIAKAGITQDERRRWIIPTEAQPHIGGHDFTWDTEEALTWALIIIVSA